MKKILILGALLLAAFRLQAIGLNNTVSQGNVQSFNYIPGSGTQTMLVLNVFTTGASSAIGSATFNGSGMTFGVSYSVGTAGRVEQWYLASPVTYSATLAYVFSGATPTVRVGIAATYNNVSSVNKTNARQLLVSGGAMGLSGTATAGNWSVFMVGALAGGNLISSYGDGGFVARRFSSAVGTTFVFGDEPASAVNEAFGCGCTDTITGSNLELVAFVPTATPTSTPTSTGTPTSTITQTLTATQTFTRTNTFTVSPTPTRTPTGTPTSTATPTKTNSPSPTNTPVYSGTPTYTASPTFSYSPTNSPSPTSTVTPGLVVVPENEQFFKNVDSQTKIVNNEVHLADGNGIVSNSVGYYSPPLQATVNVLGSGSWTALSPASNCKVQPCNAVLSVPATAATTWSFQAGVPAATPVVSIGEAQSVPGTPFSVNIPMLPGQTIWTNSGAATAISAAATTYGQ